MTEIPFLCVSHRPMNFIKFIKVPNNPPTGFFQFSHLYSNLNIQMSCLSRLCFMISFNSSSKNSLASFQYLKAKPKDQLRIFDHNVGPRSSISHTAVLKKKKTHDTYNFYSK